MCEDVIPSEFKSVDTRLMLEYGLGSPRREVRRADTNFQAIVTAFLIFIFRLAARRSRCQ